MDDVYAAASSLLRRVADGGEIPLEAVREFAELVLCSELVAGSHQVLDGPAELAVRRAVELASVVLASGVSVARKEESTGSK